MRFFLSVTMIVSGILEGLAIATGQMYYIAVLMFVPALVAEIYIPNASVWYIVPMFMIVITAVGVIIGILTLCSESVWPSIWMYRRYKKTHCYDM